jgi:hypothetical protein
MQGNELGLRHELQKTLATRVSARDERSAGCLVDPRPVQGGPCCSGSTACTGSRGCSGDFFSQQGRVCRRRGDRGADHSDRRDARRARGGRGAVHRALATLFGRLAPDFRSQLAAFRLRCQAQYPDAQSFAALTHEQQIAFLTQVERTPFFERVRLLTLLGMFALPKYGGNRDHVGWKLIGFQDQHIFSPPFGYYDRDYPGFSIQVVERP